MQPNPQWQPPREPPLPPPGFAPPPARRPWLPTAIIASAILIAAGLVAGALILKKGHPDPVAGPSTCQSWTETRLTLQSVPALPDGWTWTTPDIDTLIKNQNAPVETALNLFEPKIAADPADVAQAARDYVAARRKQSAALSDRSYTPEMGAQVDSALQQLNQLCGIPTGGRPI